MIQSATFKQIAGHLSELITFIAMAEAGAGKKAHRRVVVRCELAIAALQVEIGGPAVAKRAQIIADVHGWYNQTGEHVERCQSLRFFLGGQSKTSPMGPFSSNDPNAPSSFPSSP